MKEKDLEKLEQKAIKAVLTFASNCVRSAVNAKETSKGYRESTKWKHALDVKVQCSACGADIFQENYYSNKTCGECGNIAGAWMHKEPDWKILDVNDLSDCPDILTGDYEFHGSSKRNGDDLQSGINDIGSGWIVIENTKRAIEELIYDNLIIRYRLKPTKKTDEELAREWSDYHINDHGCTAYNTMLVKEIAHKAFIAGRKSKDGEG